MKAMHWSGENRLARDLGFTPEVDEKRGAPWCRFKKGSVLVWSYSFGSWARATKIGEGHDCQWCNHKYYTSLQDALEMKNQNKTNYGS